MPMSERSQHLVVLCWLLLMLALPAASAQPNAAAPLLRYDTPAGFGSSTAEGAEAWVSDRLDGVIHVYGFRAFHGDFQQEFRRMLFEDRISVPYREDRLLAAPVFKALPVQGADASLAASFRNFNGGAPREHFRVAILASGFVALVDVSANSPEAFQKNWVSVSTLLRSLRVVARGASTRRNLGRVALGRARRMARM
jgi:hypothetical protein